MEGNKLTFFEKLRLKTKLPNTKKPRKKPLAKQGRNMLNRRSMSVPDLTLVPGLALATESSLTSKASDAISFSISSGQSDTDSVASWSNTDGPLNTDKINEPVPEITFRTHPNPSAAALKKLSAPVEVFSYEEPKITTNSDLDNKMALIPENLYTQVNKKRNVPLPLDSSVLPRNTSGTLAQSDLSEGLSLSGETEKELSDNVASALPRVSSQGKEMTPFLDKSTPLFEPKKFTFQLTPPVKRKNASAERLALQIPLGSGDGNSVDSPCTSPTEERTSISWAKEIEVLMGDTSNPLLMSQTSMEDSMLEPDEYLDETSAEAGDNFDESSLYPSESSDFVSSGPDIQSTAPFQRYLLNINLKWGKNLVIRDKRSGSSDPYVKFKLEGKQFYKSKVVYKSLNPRWNESFSHAIRDREHNVELRVYDKNRTADEFMGSTCISLTNLELYKTYEMDLPLEDSKSKEDDMGIIGVEVCLMHRDATIKKGPRFRQKKNKQNQALQNNRSADASKNQAKSQMWSGVFRITLVEGQDLPPSSNGDVYVRFRLGDQKYKSKNLCIQENPQWREEFDFNKFEDNQELQVEVFSKKGRKGEESWGIFEIDLSKLALNESQLYTHMLNPGKGKLVFLVILLPCWGVSISDVESSTLANPEEKDAIIEKFSLRNCHHCVGEVGFLQVNIIRANELPSTDINGKTNPLCVVELGNCKLQTTTSYKTGNPEWNQAFTFPIKDINDVVELTVLDENGDKSPNFLGKVAIPLLSVQNGQQMCLYLKKENLERTAKGTITLQVDVIYNKVRAGIRTFQPKESKLIEENLKINKKILARNIYRVRKISTAVLYTLQYIKSCFQWQSTQRSLMAFLIFLVTVWHWDLFMLPLFLLLLIGWNYYQLSTGKASSNQDLVNMTMGDDEEEDEKEPGKKGLMDKIHMVQEVVLVVQTSLEEVANMGERIKNIFNWSVPFLSSLACLVLFVATVLLYYIPLRYIVLIWGINKFTKKLRKPYSIDGNEMLDFLVRVPSDVQKVQYSAQRAPTSQNQKKKR
uniref:Multiple C2 domains, transmembrane 2a n=1 Tax=Oryzias sinensis TaxID=183150 RepID=A0A8C7ZLV2_9TELE